MRESTSCVWRGIAASCSRRPCDARLYLQAEADCVFPIRLADDDLIGAFVRRVEGPVNLVGAGAPPLPRLAKLGVARSASRGHPCHFTMAVLCTDDATCLFAGLLEADEGTRTLDLLHGKYAGAVPDSSRSAWLSQIRFPSIPSDSHHFP
jgi:hypothetical protein